MAKNLSKPFSIRLTEDLEAEVAHVMAEGGLRKNPAILHLLSLGAFTFRDAPKLVVKAGPTPEKPALKVKTHEELKAELPTVRPKPAKAAKAAPHLDVSTAEIFRRDKWRPHPKPTKGKK